MQKTICVKLSSRAGRKINKPQGINRAIMVCLLLEKLGSL